MDWKDLGGQLARAGAPIIGGALGGPLGGMLGGVVGNVLADALGTDATPEAVGKAIATATPAEVAEKLAAADAEAHARWPALAEIAKAEHEARARGIESVNETIRAEVQAAAARPDGWWSSWRTILAYELAVECPVWAALMIWATVTGRVADVVALSGLLTTWWGARFGLLGVHVWTGSHERLTAITGQPAPSVVGEIVKAVKGKR